MKILFVCTANISRSYLAEQLFNHEMVRLGLRACCASAGVSALSGYPPDPGMVDFLHEQGKTTREHLSQPVTKELVDWADLILVMERYHRQKILDRWPEAGEKTRLLGEFLPDDNVVDDIIDPYGGSPYHYRLAQGQIGLAVQSLIEKMVLSSADGHA